VLRAVILTQYRRVTERWTDEIAIASTALAMWALRRAVKINKSHLHSHLCYHREIRHSVAVCLFVSLFVRTITFKRFNAGRWNLAVRCTVQQSHPSLNVKVKGQGHRGQKNKIWWLIPTDNARQGVARTVGHTLHAAADESIVWPPGVTAVHVDGGLRAVLSGAVLTGVTTMVGKSAHAA